ncbi:MAG: hypothetical protein CJBNEKGG_04441 [Prosthecobacter sp.]|nr:hypothetical protein [Prosthecobacter sp.]
MSAEIPEWINSLMWPDGGTVHDMLVHAPEVVLQPALKSELQAVWQQRMREATTMGNEPWRARTQEICDWLTSASADLKFLVLVAGKKRRGMLIDEQNKSALPM